MKKGFTLIEVLAAALIVAVTFAGLVASFNASRTYIIRSGKRLLAANLAASKINELSAAVRADTWDTGDLAPATYNFGSGDYTGTYTVENVKINGEDAYRKMTMTINYPDIQ